MKHWKCWFFSGSFILTLVLIAGCRMPDFDSVWRDRAIAIDGKDDPAEWENARYYFEKKKVTVGLMNDADKLYIRISTRDRSLQRQLMALGCTMWFDESGKKNKKLGIRFPLGIQGHAKALMQGSARFGADSTQVDAILDAVQTDLALIGPYPNEINKLSVTEASKYDIACRIGLAEGNLVYEIQYPLHRTETCPYGIFTTPVKSLKIGFITPKVAARRGGSGQGSMSGEMMGGGMRGGMSGTGRRGMGQPNMPNLAPEPLELWITVKIAGKPAGALVDSADMEAVVSAADSAGRVK